METKFFFFQKSLKFEFWLLTNSWNHLSFVNIGPTLVIDTSMERYLLVLQHGNPKFFFQKSLKFKFWLLTKSWNHLSFVNISSTLLIDTSMERSSWVLHHGNPKIIFFFLQKSLKFEFWLLTKSWNHLGFVNISTTLVIDTSMERSSRVLQHGNPKIRFFFKIPRFEFWLLTKSWNHPGFVNISPTLVIDTSMEWSSRVKNSWKPRNVKIFQKVRNWQNWILSVPRVSVWREKKSPWLRQYQSYISNWYVNGKVFTSTTTWEPKNLIFFQKSSKLNLTCILTCAEELKSFK